MQSFFTKKINIWQNIFLVLIVVILEAVFFRQIIFNNNLLSGESIDSRLNVLVMEHWHQSFSGAQKWRDLPIFYPYQNTLGYSDTVFLLSLPFSVSRLFGNDLWTSYQITMFAVHLLGGMCLLYFFRAKLKLSFAPTLIGIIIANYSNAFYLHISHNQLLTLSFLPLLLIFIFNFIQNIKLNNLKKRLLFGALSILLFCAILFSNIYMAFFATIYTAVFIMLLLLHTFIYNKKIISLFLKNIKQNLVEISFYCVIFVVALLPFLIVYLPTAKQFGARSYHNETINMLPEWYDFFNISNTNLVWSFPTVPDRPYGNEMDTGFTPVVFLSFLISLSILIYNFVIKSKSLRKTTPIIFIGFLAILLCFVLIVKWQNHSLWHVVYRVVPAASAVRAVSRFNLFLTLPLGILLACVLSNINNKTRFFKISLFVLLIIIFLEQQNLRPSFASWNKTDMEKYLEVVPAPPANCQSFYIVNDPPNGQIFNLQLNSWMIGAKYNLPTINGYSGNWPEDYNEFLMFLYDQGEDKSALDKWISKYQLKNVCAYDVKAQQWSFHQPQNQS